MLWPWARKMDAGHLVVLWSVRGWRNVWGEIRFFVPIYLLEEISIFALYLTALTVFFQKHICAQSFEAYLSKGHFLPWDECFFYWLYLFACQKCREKKFPNFLEKPKLGNRTRLVFRRSNQPCHATAYLAKSALNLIYSHSYFQPATISVNENTTEINLNSIPSSSTDATSNGGQTSNGRPKSISSLLEESEDEVSQSNTIKSIKKIKNHH